jgi:hypothetical protein
MGARSCPRGLFFYEMNGTLEYIQKDKTDYEQSYIISLLKEKNFIKGKINNINGF